MIHVELCQFVKCKLVAITRVYFICDVRTAVIRQGSGQSCVQEAFHMQLSGDQTNSVAENLPPSARMSYMLDGLTFRLHTD
jgi:hypothetical protein